MILFQIRTSVFMRGDRGGYSTEMPIAPSLVLFLGLSQPSYVGEILKNKYFRVYCEAGFIVVRQAAVMEAGQPLDSKCLLSLLCFPLWGF